ncbi:MAG: hypothetical protein ACYCOU_01370 [Sulfobacillus sp.]
MKPIEVIREMQEEVLAKMHAASGGLFLAIEVAMKWRMDLHGADYPHGTFQYNSSGSIILGSDQVERYERLLEFTPHIGANYISVTGNVHREFPKDEKYPASEYIVGATFSIAHPPEYLQALKDCGSLVTETYNERPRAPVSYQTIRCSI